MGGNVRFPTTWRSISRSKKWWHAYKIMMNCFNCLSSYQIRYFPNHVLFSPVLYKNTYSFVWMVWKSDRNHDKTNIRVKEKAHWRMYWGICREKVGIFYMFHAMNIQAFWRFPFHYRNATVGGKQTTTISICRTLTPFLLILPTFCLIFAKSWCSRR